MANICSNYMTIGFNNNPESIRQYKDLVQRIGFRKKDRTLKELFPLLMRGQHYGLINLKIKKDSVFVSFDSPWEFPEDPFYKLCNQYPQVVFDVQSIESQMAYYLDGHAEDGNVSLNRISAFDYLLKYNLDFAAEYKRVTEMPYDELLKYDLSDIDSDFSEHMYLLEVPFLNRVQDKDLPLFMNYEWTTSEAKSLFLSRIKAD